MFGTTEHVARCVGYFGSSFHIYISLSHSEHRIPHEKVIFGELQDPTRKEGRGIVDKAKCTAKEGHTQLEKMTPAEKNKVSNSRLAYFDGLKEDETSESKEMCAEEPIKTVAAALSRLDTGVSADSVARMAAGGLLSRSDTGVSADSVESVDSVVRMAAGGLLYTFDEQEDE